MVVLDDADVQAAAEAGLVASFLCAGQSCTAGERFLVHESVHDEFVDALQAAVERSIRLGDPFAEETTMGPLNNEPTAQKMDRHVGDAVERGARLVTGGARASGHPTDLYWEATVLTGVTEEMDVAREETFGPVVPITKISSDEEALQIANASPYGLLTAVWTRDLRAGFASPKQSTRAGSTSTSRPTTGRATSPSAAGPERAPGWAASAEARSSRPSPSRRPSSSRSTDLQKTIRPTPRTTRAAPASRARPTRSPASGLRAARRSGRSSPATCEQEVPERVQECGCESQCERDRRHLAASALDRATPLVSPGVGFGA